jgi:phospholipid-binding lipoprotein MlaA
MIINKDNVGLLNLVLVVLAMVAAGCAVSKRTSSSSLVMEASSNEQQPLTDANGVSSASDEPDGGLANDEFGLLEEELTERMVEVADPLEPLNRMMYGINDILYFWVAKPIAQVYRDVAPQPIRIGIRNFFNNLTTPIRFVNCHLQGKVKSADRELERFLINTTSGILGFGDPARDKMGLEPVEEDLGQTLAVHGFGNGFYIVLPLLGPSTLRDTVGFVGDQFLNPARYVEPLEVSIGISGVKVTNEGSFHIGEYEDFKSAAIDPYVAMRQVYIQYRKRQIQE